MRGGTLATIIGGGLVGEAASSAPAATNPSQIHRFEPPIAAAATIAVLASAVLGCAVTGSSKHRGHVSARGCRSWQRQQRALECIEAKTEVR